MDICQLFFQYLKSERIQVSTYIYFVDSLFTSRGILVFWASIQKHHRPGNQSSDNQFSHPSGSHRPKAKD